MHTRLNRRLSDRGPCCSQIISREAAPGPAAVFQQVHLKECACQHIMIILGCWRLGLCCALASDKARNPLGPQGPALREPLRRTTWSIQLRVLRNVASDVAHAQGREVDQVWAGVKTRSRLIAGS